VLVRRIEPNRSEVLGLKIGVVLENLLLGGAGGKPAEDVPDRDAQSTDAGLAGTLAGLDGNSGIQSAAHGEMIARFRMSE